MLYIVKFVALFYNPKKLTRIKKKLGIVMFKKNYFDKRFLKLSC